MKPGIFDLAADAYYADRLTEEISLNATVLKAFITDSPLHGWTQHPRLNPDYEEKTDAKFDVGKAAHALFLQGEEVAEEQITFQAEAEAVRVATLVKVEGKPFALVADARDWKAKAAQQVRDRSAVVVEARPDRPPASTDVGDDGDVLRLEQGPQLVVIGVGG